MRIQLLVTATLISVAAAAQCDPVITPGEPEPLCPGESVTIMTGTFDSYQWYADGELLAGATEQSLTVTYEQSGLPFSVEVTHDGCTAMSPIVWVDGWNWLPPFVIHGGDESIATGPNGEAIHCEGQVLLLEMSMGYTNVTWTNMGTPIEEANDNILEVTESGSYSASASPVVCPNFVNQLGVTIDVEFIAPQQPVIMSSEDEICAFPLGATYTWYYNDEVIAGENNACIMVAGAGAYSVFVEYGLDCEVMSEPYITMSSATMSSSSLWTVFPNPSNGIVNISMDAGHTAGAVYSITDMVGRVVATGRVPMEGLLQLDMDQLGNGSYLFQAARDGKAMAPATRFSVVK